LFVIICAKSYVIKLSSGDVFEQTNAILEWENVDNLALDILAK